MNICEERHEPKYKVTYKPARGGKHTPEWLVCEACVNGKNYFGDMELIESIEIII